MTKQLAAASRKLIDYVNTVVWQEDKIEPTGTFGFPATLRGMVAERAKILFTTEFVDLKKAIENLKGQ
jgi:hypothetical protein